MRERRKLLRAVMGFTETDLFLRADREMSPEAEGRYRNGYARRLHGEPLAYIIGEETFYHRPFYVSPAVLIPRPETELLIELAKALAPKRALDLCTGSGIIAVTLQKELGCDVTASDVSPEALIVARRNADRHRATVHLIQSDLFEAVADTFDLIITNPPYIDEAVLPELEVAAYEPRLALDGGVGGLEVYRRLIKQAPEYLTDDGILLMEIGYDQGEPLSSLLQDRGFSSIEIYKDLAGFDRVIKALYRRNYDR